MALRQVARYKTVLYSSLSQSSRTTCATASKVSCYSSGTTAAMVKVDTSSTLAGLRGLMKERGVDIYIVPSEDSHHSEYIAPCDARREFLTGFTGSAGCAVVTTDIAALATDGRYFNQASQQLDKNWILLKQGLPDVPPWQDWAAEQSSGGKTVAVDPSLIPATAAARLSDKIKRSGGAELKAIYENLVDIVWGAYRPIRPCQPIAVQPHQFAGRSVQEKLRQVREVLAKRNSPALAVSTLDDIAWLFNLRGGDIPFNPVFFSYAIVTAACAKIYVNESQLTTVCRQHLQDNGVEVQPYSSIFDDSHALFESLSQTSNYPTGTSCKRFTISNTTSWALKLALGGNEAVDDIRSPIGDLKAVKNDVEISGMRACHLRDAAALVEYLAWLEDQLVTKNAVLDEVTAADKLEQLRSKQEDFVGLSFPTVSATGANAAIIHYQPHRESCSVIDPEAIYLCDSGAQYLDGTTDTTRTVHFGRPTAAEKRAYTLVLKGHIALDMAIFPKGTSGFALDCLARQYLRRDGLDYRHSTGHGVGSYLNVHEGPIGIGTRPEFAEVPLQSGNIISNEPGYYEDGAYGIRIENVVVVKHVKTPNRFGGECYMGFESVTMVPLCRNLIEVDLLSDEEKGWLNGYHSRIFEALKGVFADDMLTLSWLTRETGLY